MYIFSKVTTLKTGSLYLSALNLGETKAVDDIVILDLYYWRARGGVDVGRDRTDVSYKVASV